MYFGCLATRFAASDGVTYDALFGIAELLWSRCRHLAPSKRINPLQLE